MAATSTLLQLGEFQFSLQNGVHESLDRGLSWRWPVQERLSRKPASQFTGPNLDTITLAGVIYPGNSGRQNTIDQIKAMADKGTPYMLTDGLGRVYGPFAIASVREGRRLFMDNGAARQIDFTLELLEYGPDQPGDRASPLQATALSGFAGVAANALQGVAPFVGAGSAFQALDWATNPVFGVASGLAQAAGIQVGQLGAIASQVAGPNLGLLGGALQAFGLGDLNPSQAGGWLQAGVNAAGLTQQVAAGNGAQVVNVGLSQLQGLATQALGSVASTIAGPSAPALRDLVGAAGTLAPILNVDPKLAQQVRSALVLE